MDKMRFSKLMASMGGKVPLSNPGIDLEQSDDPTSEDQIAIIDNKIAQLEESDDPNALDSLNFWKKRRAQLTGE